MWTQIIDAVGGGLLGGVDKVVKTIFGSEEARDQATANEDIQRLKQYAAEFSPRENRTWWDSLVDGLNRLPRPIMTFGVIWLFYSCMTDPAAFAVSMEALGLMPTSGWALLMTIVGFWFGGKFLGGLSKKATQAPDPEHVERVLSLMDKLEERRSKKASVDGKVSLPKETPTKEG